ncbi:hypothetical protein DFQ26_009093 [Actinomortierella ambigua]|nr:hypothetical protein DFQ26_009093 [Actinomortierella ambigua]
MSPTQFTNKQVLVSPMGDGVQPSEAHFRTVTITQDKPTLAPNQLFIKNLSFSMEPLIFYDFSTGANESKVRGFGMAQVLESTNPNITPGSIVHITMPWEEYSVIQAESGNPLGDVIVHSPSDRHLRWSNTPLTAYNGVLGIPGFTAWDALRVHGDLKPGEVIYVNSAAGTLGSLAGQLAKRKGLRVIGSAGSQAKLDYLLNELGFDEVFNYKAPGGVRRGLEQALASLSAKQAAAAAAAATKTQGSHLAVGGGSATATSVGLDVYFDLVNEVPSLEAVMDLMNPHGRILSVGMIADQLNDKPTHGPKNYMQILNKQLQWCGYIVMERYMHYHEFVDELEPLISSREIKYVEHVVNGNVDDIPTYFVKAQQGAFLGKVSVSIAAPGV